VLAVGAGARPSPPVLESGGGRRDLPPARLVILSGERWRRSGGRVEAEPIAEPEVIARVVEVLAAGLLRAGRLPLLVDVGPEQVLGAGERAGRGLEPIRIDYRICGHWSRRTGRRSPMTANWQLPGANALAGVLR